MTLLKHIDRLKDVALLLIKYGRSDLVEHLGIDLPIHARENATKAAKNLPHDLQKLGPTFVKLGQLLSTQYDLFTEPYKEALTALHDHAESFSFEEVEKIILEELHVPISEIFLDFNPIPFAAASLSQVHQARLLDNSVVAVKVQRPHIQKQIINDLEMIEELALFLDKRSEGSYFWKAKFDNLKNILVNELDFQKEADHLLTFKKNLHSFKNIIIPAPIKEYTTARILTMEYISTHKITPLHPIVKTVESNRLAKTLFSAYLKQIFYDGFVHIDPHPGNIYLNDNNQLVLLDLGMVEHISAHTQQDLLQLLWAISEGRGEDAADTIIKMGSREENFNDFQFRQSVSTLIAQHKHLNWEQMNIGRTILRISKHAIETHLQLPTPFVTFGKTLMNLDAVVRILAPEFKPYNYVRKHIKDFFKHRVKEIVSKESLYRLVLELAELFQQFPSKLNGILEKLYRNEIRIKIQSFNENRLMRGFEKVANRIALGLVLAALIVGAALLMRIETSFRLFGYPGLAILLFLAAAIGGLFFIINILLHDKDERK